MGFESGPRILQIHILFPFTSLMIYTIQIQVPRTNSKHFFFSLSLVCLFWDFCEYLISHISHFIPVHFLKPLCNCSSSSLEPEKKILFQKTKQTGKVFWKSQFARAQRFVSLVVIFSKYSICTEHALVP